MVVFPLMMLKTLFNRFVVLQDLEPGCLTLTTLRKETLEFLSNNTAPTLVARKVILAEYDNIVSPAKFISQDPKSAPRFAFVTAQSWPANLSLIPALCDVLSRTRLATLRSLLRSEQSLAADSHLE